MMSKNLLIRSLFSVYKDMLYLKKEKGNDELKEEIWGLAQDPSFFTQKEIVDNKEWLSRIEDMSTCKTFVCHIDGSLKVEYENEEEKTGKKVKAGCSFIIESNGQTIIENYFPIPLSYENKDTSSHIAEYQALVSCLRVLSFYHHDPRSIDVVLYSDSEVLTKQMNLEIRTRDDVQRELKKEAQEYARLFNNVTFKYCPREQNQRADMLAKKSIEEKEWVQEELLFELEDIK